MPDGNSAALADYQRREDEPFDEDEAAEFWERHDREMADYRKLREEIAKGEN